DKGIEESVIADAVSTVDADQELATARKLVKRKLATMTRLDPQVQTRRLAGLLARKGYAPSTAFQIVREVIGEVAAGTDSEDTAWLA
ncbi:MAG: RecX family transcriptional regulator, partial [Jatrophihabitantaceae bacterium]